MREVSKCTVFAQSLPLKTRDIIKNITNKKTFARSQIDLIDFRVFELENEKYKRILNIVDDFLKFCFDIKLKYKSMITVKEGQRKFLQVWLSSDS